MDDLISRLRALSRHEHSDYSIGDEAADALEAAREDAERWRTYEAGGGEGTSHVCVKCGHPYWPEGENEDCPKCEHDGSAIAAAIASLSAPQPPAEAPPSAPVGVEGLVVKWKKESESLDIHPAGLAARRVCAIELEHALSRQPAAVDGADAQDAEIEALRVRADAMAGEAIKHEARAERLAEAIKAYKSECDNPAKDYVLRAKRRDEMFALLHGHDQEVGNG